MSNVLPFRQKESRIENYLSGKALCLGCQHRWHAHASIGTFSLDCPACHLPKGRFIQEVIKDCAHWICNCKNEYFSVTQDAIYCPNCGQEQEF